MKFHELNASKHKSSRRVGRGIAAGRGKTAGRGTKGQGARAGFKKRPGFEGGQNPLMQRLPKLPGFRSHRAKADTVFTDELTALKTKTIDANALAKAGLVKSPYTGIKLLSRGDVTSAMAVKLPAASKSAVAALEAKGGSFEKTAKLQRPKTRADQSDKTD